MNTPERPRFSTDYIAQAAVIAALYTVLTMVAAGFDLASGAVQVRFSEALTILPYFTPAAVPGLTLGCLISNLVTGCALPDIIFGSLATLICRTSSSAPLPRFWELSAASPFGRTAGCARSRP